MSFMESAPGKPERHSVTTPSLFTAAQILRCFRVLTRFALTQILTQNTKCSDGHNGRNLRVLPDFAEQKRFKALRSSALSPSGQLITRRSEVQALPPQPKLYSSLNIAHWHSY